MSSTLAAARPLAMRLSGAALIGALALALGALAAVQPFAGLAVAGFVVLIGLAFLMPVTHLMILLFITVVAPYELQNSLSVGGAGLLPSDALLIAALFRASIVLLLEPLEGRRMLVVGVTLAFLVVAGLQAIVGFQLGRGAGQVGYELRVVLGFGALLVAMPLVTDPAGMRRVGRGLLVVGLLLGTWGLAQWFLGIEEIGESGVGVREGISQTSSGRGQLQGGLYGFPVAVVLAFSALVGGYVRSFSGRALILTVLFTNFLSLILTYERTFWVTTLLGMGFIILKAAPRQRARALVWGPAALVALLGAMATAAPGDLAAAQERLVSLGQYSSDDSVRSRVVETRHVATAIEASPWAGSGLGATVFFGRPWQNVHPEATWYAHNGYLWLSWKMGIPAAVLLTVLMGWAVLTRAPPGEDDLVRSMRIGTGAALLVLLLSSVTFPAFNALAITAVMGVLAAICFAPPMPSRSPPPG